MPAVGMGWQWRWRGRLEVPSPQQATHPPCLLLAGPPLQSLGRGEKKKREGEKSSQERKGRWRDTGTEEKLGDSIMSPTKDRPLIAQLTCSPSPPSLRFLVISLSLLGNVLCWERIFANSRACRQFWGRLKSCQFNSCVYGLGPGRGSGK